MKCQVNWRLRFNDVVVDGIKCAIRPNIGEALRLILPSENETEKIVAKQPSEVCLDLFIHDSLIESWLLSGVKIENGESEAQENKIIIRYKTVHYFSRSEERHGQPC
jgi:hypothetical protein